MKLGLSTGVAALALLLAGCGGDESGNNSIAAPDAPIAAVPAPNGGKWTDVVAETAEGGYLMGNPNAAVKLVEYASYTCPHCEEFSEQATEPLKELVASGKLSWEFRPFVLFPTDPGITMLVRCQEPAAAFLLTEQLYAEQAQWAGRLRDLSDAQAEQLQALSPKQRVTALLQAAGLDQFFRQRGMPQEKISTCTADQANLDRVMEITETGKNQYQVTGTPTFFINGQKVSDASTWAQLQPVLRRALGQ
jgi:protein-disulfide isomerase